jgi:RNA polymerase sigma factor (sigma-70 family)
MASVPVEKARSLCRTDANRCDSPVLADEHLLDLFLSGDGGEAEAAFQALVRRHGPMVLGVCRHILDQVADAEDAFQATFLVLARKAGSIRDRRVLGRWLYEVAYRIAVRAKTNTVRRRIHERQGAEMSAVAPGPRADHAWCELRPVLHEEVNRLPEKYRTAVVLCYLEGRTNEEAAEMLRWPVGTVKGRLSRAREILRRRLTRRGLTLSAAFLVVCLSRNSVFAEIVPSRLADVTVRSALLATRGDMAAAATIPARVSRLADGAIPPPDPMELTAQGATAVVMALLVATTVLFGAYAALIQEGVIRVGDGPGIGSFIASSLAPLNEAPAAGGCHSAR